MGAEQFEREREHTGEAPHRHLVIWDDADRDLYPWESRAARLASRMVYRDYLKTHLSLDLIVRKHVNRFVNRVRIFEPVVAEADSTAGSADIRGKTDGGRGRWRTRERRLHENSIVVSRCSWIRDKPEPPLTRRGRRRFSLSFSSFSFFLLFFFFVLRFTTRTPVRNMFIFYQLDKKTGKHGITLPDIGI